MKFNLNGSDIPTLVNIIPALLDLDDANDIRVRKTLKIFMNILRTNYGLFTLWSNCGQKRL